MRIDKFLWSVRYFKSRSEATLACKKGHVRIDGEAAKPSREVYPQTSITVRKNQVNLELKVLDLPPNRVGAKLVDVYRLDTTPAEAFENQEMLRYAKNYYRSKGSGRPSKKDRRDLDGFFDEE